MVFLILVFSNRKISTARLLNPLMIPPPPPTSTVQSQIEFYFSNNTIDREKLMKIATSSSPGGYVSIDLLLTFPRLLQLINNNSDIIDAVKSSRYLMLSDDKKMIRRRHPYQILFYLGFSPDLSVPIVLLSKLL